MILAARMGNVGHVGRQKRMGNVEGVKIRHRPIAAAQKEFQAARATGILVRAFHVATMIVVKAGDDGGTKQQSREHGYDTLHDLSMQAFHGGSIASASDPVNEIG